MLSKMELFNSLDVDTSVPTTLKPASISISPKKIIHDYKCDGRKHCSQMGSYEEAVYFNKFCPDTKMDGDDDGIPCEKQFNRW